ncbi:NLR family CARD domain-containing protein 3 CARD15-like protein [Collichthys lucidus]|uniref:NLR family CARD domain-containing protein 3 CARD15-like protein n=1 Tax=Collichthys lucidus TaxID=240159 RepID=A0A4U5U6R6_COLLU|nr:NLR family CARD domain-containing protein 3 CARD15-like protein [Collichthys lucidus]
MMFVFYIFHLYVFSGTAASLMDLQICLRNALKNKYQELNEAHLSNSLLPSRLCFRPLNASVLQQQEFRFVDKSNLDTLLNFPPAQVARILSCDCKHESSKRTVITLGVCGVGKSTTVQRCALEWAEENWYHGIRLLFPLTFWELNVLKHKLSLIELLQTFYPELKELDVSTLNNNNVWFILDGLDEYHLPLNFSCRRVNDILEVSKVDILVTNLIRGNLLPKAHIWITTRHAAATQIPESFLLKVTEVLGFSDEQKEQHFRAVIGNVDLANKAIDHVKVSRSLDFLCQIPPICSIMANVLKKHVETVDKFKFNPLNLTQIYTNLVQTSNPVIVSKLGMLALRWMDQNNVIYEHDLKEGNISFEEASAFSKECPLVLREEKGLRNTTVFRFGQSSIREFLAASAEIDNMEANPLRFGRCQYLVEQALQNPEGKMDVFLRFIFGLIKERRVLESSNQLFAYTKKMLLENILSDSAIGLFHCLREYDSQVLLSEVKKFQKLNISPVSELTNMQWSFPAILSTEGAYLRELDLGYNSISDDGVSQLAEGLGHEHCRLKTLRLQGCGVTAQACMYLGTVLGYFWRLWELDLSRNDIGNDGLQHLADGLSSSKCHLKTLKLSQCSIEQKGTSYLATALEKNPEYLKVLDLSINMVGDEGANELFGKLDISKMKKLEMYHCGLTASSCVSIGEALKIESSTLLELNLSNNSLKDQGFERLCEGMYAWCRLEKLNSHSGFSSEESIICELDLSDNDLQDKGVKKLCMGLRSPRCSLEKISGQSLPFHSVTRLTQVDIAVSVCLCLCQHRAEQTASPVSSQ